MSSSDTLMSRFSQALNSPIYNRCAELTALIDRCSSKDLQHLFPTLVESIFGTSGGISWGLHTIISTSFHNDFESVHNFLGPLGAVFRLIYKILTECSVKYEFSISYIPSKIRQILDNTNVPPFYADLLNIDSQTRKVHSLLLNAFDYYMFNFAYYLTNPWQQRHVNIWHVGNTVYYVLCCDYLLHFLPTNQNIVVLPQLTHFTGKNPVIVAPQSVTNRPQRSSKLFQTHVLQQTAADMSTLHQPMQHPRAEIWRSESVMQIFIDVWLNNDQLVNTDSTFHNKPKVNELPSGEYIRILRVLVKQLHAFSASGKYDITPLGELKKIVQPMLNGRMYAFLRHLVYRWPLDGSFRLVLELWLSFIQPWRYVGDGNIKQQDQDNDEANTKVVETQYLSFISDNLLAYTVIFQQLLPRFSRIDLSSPKNALMLYRVCKVFGQQNLVPMIRDIEICVDNLNQSPTHSYHLTGPSTLPPLSPTFCWSTNTSPNTTNQNITEYPDISLKDTTLNDTFHCNRSFQPSINVTLNNKWAALVRHRIYEWEGPEFCYKSMFSNRPAPEVFQLLRHIQQCEAAATGIVANREAENIKKNQGFTGFFRFLTDEVSTDEFTLEERKKAPIYLNCAKQYLMEIFQLEITRIDQVSGLLESNLQDQTASFSGSPTPTLDLTPNGSRIRARNIKYEGDPDLYPVRSSENAMLVRVLYQLAQKINEKYGEQMQQIWNRRDFIGKMSRQILFPPQLTHYYDKSICGYSPRVSKVLPPRVSLRYLAGHRFLAYSLLGVILFRFFGYSALTFFIAIFIFWLFLILLQTCFAHDNVIDNTAYTRRIRFN